MLTLGRDREARRERAWRYLVLLWQDPRARRVLAALALRSSTATLRADLEREGWAGLLPPKNRPGRPRGRNLAAVRTRDLERAGFPAVLAARILGVTRQRLQQAGYHGPRSLLRPQRTATEIAAEWRARDVRIANQTSREIYDFVARIRAERALVSDIDAPVRVADTVKAAKSGRVHPIAVVRARKLLGEAAVPKRWRGEGVRGGKVRATRDQG